MTGTGQERASVPGIKRRFGDVKVRLRGLTNNTAQRVRLFAQSNLWMARRHLLINARELRL